VVSGVGRVSDMCGLAFVDGGAGSSTFHWVGVKVCLVGGGGVVGRDKLCP
jgi:hypothetical protein